MVTLSSDSLKALFTLLLKLRDALVSEGYHFVRLAQVEFEGGIFAQELAMYCYELLEALLQRSHVLLLIDGFSLNKRTIHLSF